MEDIKKHQLNTHNNNWCYAFIWIRYLMTVKRLLTIYLYVFFDKRSIRYHDLITI